MPLLRWLAPLLIALGVAWLIAGTGSCGREASPQLVQVLDMAPRQVEVGEKVTVMGEGFPPGKTARVSFRGTLLRAGERPERGAEVVTTGTVVGPQRLELDFTEATQSLFCGAGDLSTHTTFAGEIEVAFAAASPGAPPIAGVLRRVTLDVRPGSSASDVRGDAEGQRFLSFLGLKVALDASGLMVESVTPGSRADQAGISAGDVLASFDGLRVGSLADVVPGPGVRDAQVGVRHGGGAGETVKSVAVDGFRRSPPAELLAAALIAIAALAIVLLFAAPMQNKLAASLQRMVSRLRARALSGGAQGGSAWEKLTVSLRGAALDTLPPPGAPALVDVLVCALLAAMPFGQYLVAAQLDVGVLFVAGTTTLVTAALVSSRSSWKGLSSAAHVAWQHLPGALAVASVVLMTGSLRVQEIEHAQGGWPWEWLAFRSPGALLAFVVLLASGRIEPGATQESTGIAARVEDLGASRPTRAPWREAAYRAHRLVVAGLASALFLGGWILPGLSPAAQDARPLLELAGAAWLLGKTSALVVLLTWSRFALPCRRLTEHSRRTALALVPLALLVLLSTAAWSWWAPVGPAQLLMSGTLVAGVLLAAAALAHRVFHGLGTSSSAEGRLSPFL